jgi:hypothetical protein
MSYSADEIYSDIFKTKPKSLHQFMHSLNSLSEASRNKLINSIIRNIDNYDNAIVDLCYEQSSSVCLIREVDGSIIKTGSLPDGYTLHIDDRRE